MSRPRQRNQNGIKLPFALQKELGLPDQRDDAEPKKRRGGSFVADRKERRKAARNEQRQAGSQLRRNNVGSVRASVHRSETRTSAPIKNIEVKPKPKPKPKEEQQSRLNGVKKTDKSLPSRQSNFNYEKPKRQPSPLESDSSSETTRSSSPGLVLDPNSASFKTRAAEDDAEIAALERRLGLKRNNSTKLGDDMLDFVLEGLNEDGDKKRKRDGQEWLDQKRRKVANDQRQKPERDIDGKKVYDDSGDSDAGSTTGEEEEKSTSGSDEDSIFEDELEGLTEELSEEDTGDEVEIEKFAGFDSDRDTEPEDMHVKKVRENPYVAPVAPGSTTAKYVPPSLRKRDEASNLDTLRRQTQGQLNKLSEANMVSILGEIEKIYQTNPRQDVTTVLIDLILTSFCDRAALQNTFIILHAAFLAAVYKVMGTEFGAELLVRVVERFDQEFSSVDTGKEALNLVSLLANLFTFNVISSTIIYDHIRLLLSNFSESNAELLLRIVRDCGPQLRSDDPSALKSIVQVMQDTSAEMSKNEQSINVRTRVMIDTIIDLKNNKTKNGSNATGLTGEHITRMRKALGSLNSRALRATEPLRISRADIQNSDKKGKWWLVGASWKGNEQHAVVSTQLVGDDNTLGRESTIHDEEEVDLLALAKQYRMNTDVRRSIFVAIMSASDCRDAQTRLLKLRLSTKQEQDVARVLLRCARAEPAYNPYYALLARNLCKENKKVRMGFQFGLWDFFGRMGEKADEDDLDDGADEYSTVELHQIVNIAKMYAHLIFHGDLAIGVLKTLNLGFLKEQATMFLEVLLISIMTQSKATEDLLMKVFSRAAETPQVVQGLRYFVKKNVRKSDLVSRKEKEKVKDGCRIADVAFGMIIAAAHD